MIGRPEFQPHPKPVYPPEVETGAQLLRPDMTQSWIFALALSRCSSQMPPKTSTTTARRAATLPRLDPSGSSSSFIPFPR